MPIIDDAPAGKDCLRANKTLVYCKDCVHYKKLMHSDLCMHCDLMLQTESGAFANRRVPPDGYCWRGERKHFDGEDFDAEF